MKRIIFLIIFAFGVIVAEASQFRSFWPPVYAPADKLVASLDKFRGSKIYIQKKWVDELYMYSRKHPELPALSWRAILWDAQNYEKQGNTAMSRKLIAIALKLCDKNKYPYDYHRIERLKVIWGNVGKCNFFSTYVFLFQSTEYFKSIGDWKLVADNYNEIALILHALGEEAQAIDYLRSASNYYEQNGELEISVKIKLNMANAYLSMGKRDSAFNILKQIEVNPLSKQDSNYYVKILVALSYTSPQNLKSTCWNYLSKAYSLAQKMKNGKNITLCEMNIADYYLDYKEYAQAIYYFRKYLPVKMKTINFMLDCYKGLGTCYKETAQYDSAAKYLSKYIIYKDSITNESHISDIQNMEARTKINQYESNIKTEKDKANTRLLIVCIVAVFFLFIACAISYILWNRRQKALIKQKLKEAENRELTMKLENEQLQNKEKQLELESQNRKLVEGALALSEKENALKTVQEQILSANERKELPSVVARQMDAQIKMHIDADSEWKSFKESFENVHPGFFSQLKESYPALTEYDVRLCAFIRTGMESKQIAFMLNVQPDSIKKARFRLRRKLGLQPTDSLENLLRGIYK
jgi:tetratricopeptide (TPR) repeat protein